MRHLLLAVTLLATGLGTAGSEAATATLTRDFRFEPAIPAGLEVDNLIGDVRVEPAAEGAGFEVDVKITAEADSQAEADAIARAVDFHQRDAGADSSLKTVLPESRFPAIYREDAPSGWLQGRMYVEYLGDKRRVTGDAQKGVRVRIDMVIRAPAGSRLAVRNVLGNAAADGIAGDLTLDGTLGRMSASGGSGRVVLDTGSGLIEVARHAGEVRADTGSGPVFIDECECDIGVDTGSGAVTVRRSRGKLEVDTGSGGVNVTDFAGVVAAETGSGGVTVEGLTEATSLAVDTGSGGVRVRGDLSRLERLSIDTGSGGVVLEATAWPAMEIVIDAGSSGVDLDVPEAQVSRDADGRSIVRLGDGSRRGLIETGSGSVRLRTRGSPAAD